MSIWDKINTKKEEKPVSKIASLSDELKEEIVEMRERNKAFNATNETNTYLVVCFSCESDKNTFLHSLHYKKGETFIDGYKLSQTLEVEPKIPSLRLPKPLHKNR